MCNRLRVGEAMSLNPASTESSFDAAVAEGRKKAASNRERRCEKDVTADSRRTSDNNSNSLSDRNNAAREKENNFRRCNSNDDGNEGLRKELENDHHGEKRNTKSITNDGNRNINDGHPIDGEKTAILKEALLDGGNFQCGSSSSGRGAVAVMQVSCKDESAEDVQEDVKEEGFFIDRESSPDASKNILLREDSNGCGHFDSQEGPEVIVNEDSMQSLDYEKCMLEQHFNSDTVDVLDTLDEEDDEDVL